MNLLQHLDSPEYVHVLLNPMPVYGLSMGVVAMIVAFIYRRRPVVVAALILIFLAGLSAWPTYHYGQEAYDRVKSMSDTIGGQWLDEHMERAEKLIYVFYVLAAVAAAGIFAPLKWPKTSTPLAVTAFVLAIGTLGVGGWISYPAGHVRHKEFRFEAPPARRRAKNITITEMKVRIATRRMTNTRKGKSPSRWITARCPAWKRARVATQKKSR